MKYMGDTSWWNERFKERELNLMLHEKYLEEDIRFFDKGCKILDIACGDGRNSIYLARLGYEVFAIDFSEEALDRLRYFKEKENLKIETKLADLSKDDVFNNLEKFDGVVINHYRLKPQLYSKLMDNINDDGILWVNGFRDIPKDNPNITQSDIFTNEDFICLEKYKLEQKKSYELGERKFARYIWRK